jgi:hypothetical protein
MLTFKSVYRPQDHRTYEGRLRADLANWDKQLFECSRAYLQWKHGPPIFRPDESLSNPLPGSVKPGVIAVSTLGLSGMHFTGLSPCS